MASIIIHTLRFLSWVISHFNPTGHHLENYQVQGFLYMFLKILIEYLYFFFISNKYFKLDRSSTGILPVGVKLRKQIRWNCEEADL